MTPPLRVVHAIRSGAFAGVEQFVLRLALRQALDGHAVHVIGGDESHMRGPLAQRGIGFTPATRTLQTARAIRRTASDADVVNAHMTAADVAAVLALGGSRSRVALISTRHFTRRRGRSRLLPVDAFVGGRIDAEISISRAVAASIDRPSTVVHSGVAVTDAAAASRLRTVLIAQRLEAEKRTDLGIRAFAASGLEAEGWTLQVAGDGAERSGLEALATELGVAARFLGFRTDVPHLMARAGMLLAPCTVEGLGLAVIEAMAAGLPVVAADAGGHTELLEGLDERALYSAEDRDAAARALASLASDPAGRAALGAAERDRQRTRFSLEAQAAGTETVYRRAIAARRGTGA